MVSGTIFHCRKNSWPTEEHIGRLTLQLFDFDSAAPPGQAWRKGLNGHASILKEFSITFTEATKMETVLAFELVDLPVQLGICLWSYVREEASHGRKAPIDPFRHETCRSSASHGVLLGGMG
ncbi:hypothetical protein RJ640_022712 [Escallonia rubra]|uniref:Uncharacterized protein n=1 Tax=Escallonia rubra TaxID=112253 RepID=A0AA88QXU4_9ASTE|nr:hypothetical protein RJ640_022712 [Escallonia rubra]